jgi:CBS domain-containing protein
MISNPQWRQPAQAFGQTVRRWLLMPDAESLMALAIFIDARAVCGDATLLAQVRAEVDRLLSDSDALLARFAAADRRLRAGTAAGGSACSPRRRRQGRWT